MRRIPSLFFSLLLTGLLLAAQNALAGVGDVTIQQQNGKIKAGSPVTVTGNIEPGKDLFVVICTDKSFSSNDALGQQEKVRLAKGKNGKDIFGDTAVPSSYYVLTTNPNQLAEAKSSPKGQTSGIFAFPPFKYNVRVNKIKKWSDIDSSIKDMLGPIKDEKQWLMVTFAHEKKFGINTIAKEKGKGGGNARMILADPDQQPESWNQGVTVQLDKTTGAFTVSMTPYKHIAPETTMGVYVNGKKAGTFTVEKRGFFFKTANVYMNPAFVFGGAFIIGVLFVVMGAAGGLFTAAFQITLIGTKGPIGINAGNTIKPTNLFLTLCSPITGLLTFLKEKRFAYPVAIPFAIGIVLGAFFIGPPLSAKYLNLGVCRISSNFQCRFLTG